MKPEDAEFILEHAEKQINDAHESNALVVGRLTTLIIICVTLLAGLISYAVNRVNEYGCRANQVFRQPNIQ